MSVSAPVSRTDLRRIRRRLDGRRQLQRNRVRRGGIPLDERRRDGRVGDLPGGRADYPLSAAFGVSADGSTVVGYDYRASSYEAFRWTSSGGMVGLGDLPGGGSFSSAAHDVSADGSTVVGVSRSTASGASNEAFRWTSGSGMVGLGDLPGGGFYSAASDVSADGSTIVGDSANASGIEAFMWDTSNGMRELDVVLMDLGLGPALTGWHLTSAKAISDDGLTIVGYGRNPSGNTEAWLAVIPEPSTGMLLIAGLFGLAGGRRARA